MVSLLIGVAINENHGEMRAHPLRGNMEFFPHHIEKTINSPLNGLTGRRLKGLGGAEPRTFLGVRPDSGAAAVTSEKFSQDGSRRGRPPEGSRAWRLHHSGIA